MRAALALFTAVTLAYGTLTVAAYELFGAASIGVTFFPAAGLSFAAFLLLPRRSWVTVAAGVVVGEVAVDMAQGHSLGWSLAWSAANLVEPLVGASVARHLAGRLVLDHRFALSFLVGGLLAGPPCGALIGATVLRVADRLPWGETFAEVWVGDALGVLVVTPLVLVLARPRDFVVNRTRPSDVVWISALTAAVSVVLVAVDDAPVGYAAIPILAILAVRLSARELAGAGAAVACVLTAATASGRGPWSSTGAEGVHAQLVAQQAFLLVALGSAWLLKLEVLERMKAVTTSHLAEAELQAARERDRDRQYLDAMNEALRTLAAARTSRAVLDAVRTHAPPVLDATAVTVVLGGPDAPAEVMLPTGRPGRTERAGATPGDELELRLTGRQGSMRLTRPAGSGWPEDAQIRAMAFASMVSESLDRAERQESDHRVALTLQRAIMPGDIGHLDGAHVHAGYHPASEGLEIGGDWYDVIVHEPRDRVTVVVGDVVGHSLAAAAAMGKLASAGRALAYARHTPQEILTGLDTVAANTEDAVATTIACAHIDLATHTLCYAVAGHPPPLLRSPEGSVSVLNGAQSTPLAVQGTRARTEVCVRTPPGTALLFYTDGLIEDRHTRLDDRLRELEDAFRAVDPSAPDVCDRLLSAMRPTGSHEDDIAIVCVAIDA